MSDSRPDYRSTLNLPKTDFAMKANLAQAEPASVKRWQEEGLYARAMAAREGAAPFVFHDGPPYASGPLHIGHLLNKGLKDLVVRSRLLEGQRCRFVPGWDCHGLPIEHKVMTDLVASGKAAKLDTLTDDQRRMAIRRECARAAEKFVAMQAADCRRILTLADYEHPYLTTQPEFEAAALELFATLVEKGLVYRDLKPVHWSIANRTALAEAELEYKDRQDPSVFVDFEAVDREAVARAFGTELDATPSFMIWTTTPWTLPANLAIAVHERFRYALVRMDGAETVVASELVDAVARAAGCETVERLAEAEGAALVGLQYRHPFMDRTGRVVAAEYVTLTDGTGLVHTAPGHGEEDYRTGLREKLPIYCPVRDDGTYDDSVPEWLRGQSVWDANGLVVERLRGSGHLVHEQPITHSYPHDWRSKTPVIFRATEQWFIGVDRGVDGGGSLRERALEATASGVRFVPEWGRNRMRGMLESRPDWCISRQRAWGLPIPAFALPDGRVLMTPASIRAVAAVVRRKGSDAWFMEPPAALLEGWNPASDAAAPEGVRVEALVKLHDIFDVWFESGSTWHAVMRTRELGYPCDLYLEGSDQHRGWFQSSLLPALGATGVAPFRTLVTHGFIVDKDGRKMGKSEGNAIELETLLKEFGADVARWWVGSISYDADIKADMEFFRRAGDAYRKIRNTLRFLLSNLGDVKGGASALPALAEVPPTSLDGWALGELSRLEAQVRRAMLDFDFRSASLALYDFCNDTLSGVYCAAVKDRLYCDRSDSPRRRRTQRVMWECVEVLCRLLGPFVPHTANEAYASLLGDPAARLELQTHRGLNATADERWSQVMAAREPVLKALEEAKGRGVENPLDAGVRLPDPDGALKAMQPELADLFGVSRVELVAGAAAGAAVEILDLRDQPRCDRSWKRDGTVRTRSDGGMLSDRDAAALGLT